MFNYATKRKAPGTGLRLYPSKKTNYLKKPRYPLLGTTQGMTAQGVGLGTGFIAGVYRNAMRRKSNRVMKGAFDCVRDIPQFYENKKFYLRHKFTENFAAWNQTNNTNKWKVTNEIRIDDIISYQSFFPPGLPDSLIKQWSEIRKYYKRYTVLGCVIQVQHPSIINPTSPANIQPFLFTMADIRSLDKINEVRQDLNIVYNCSKNQPIMMIPNGSTRSSLNCRTAKYSIRMIDGLNKSVMRATMSRSTTAETIPSPSQNVRFQYMEYIPPTYDAGSTNPSLVLNARVTATYQVDWVVVAFDRINNPN